MAGADQQQTADGDEAAVPFASSAAAVSYLFREHNRVLVGYLTARLKSEQEAKEVAQEAYVRLLHCKSPAHRVCCALIYSRSPATSLSTVCGIAGSGTERKSRWSRSRS